MLAGHFWRTGVERRFAAVACSVLIALLAVRVEAQTAAQKPNGFALTSTPAPAPVPSVKAPSQPPQATPPAAAAAPPPSPLNPTPQEFPGPRASSGASDVDGLLSRVAALRTRIAALTAALFSSRLRIELASRGDAVRLKSVSVSLDGGIVYRAGAEAVLERPEVVFEHAVAPGPHVIGVEVERQDAARPEFSTWQASRFMVMVPEKRALWTRVELEDDSSMARDFVEDEAGEYELRVRLAAEVGD